ncbi:MAG: peroxiredoxin [Proteobacteria bacterium]|nr:peroxiredoxin [Pseudomonadota bacterium]MCP4918025.1 peroxiredoxin [Pseudomonadota bacterium]
MAGPEVGDACPDFEGETNEGQVSLASLAGKRFVLYFYPKDQTPGCITEACGFRDLSAEFAQAGAVIYGVSKDSLKSHANFIAKQSLNFELLSDPEKTVHAAFTTWVEKKNYGRVYMGTQRSTFLVDENGVLQGVWRNVRVKGHVDKVLEATRALS